MKDEHDDIMDFHTYLSFRMNEELFAVDVSQVHNILELIQITRVPKAKKYMKGVLNLRGAVLPVVDLRVKFGLPVKENNQDTSIIVATINKDEEEVMVGLLVDGVDAVRQINNSDIISSAHIGTKYNSEVLKGLINDGEKFIMLLNLDKVFSYDQMFIESDDEKNKTVEV